ncbi:MAG: primosomal protein N' [bacterium]
MHRYVAQIALNIPKDTLFSYLVPSELTGAIKPGHLVYVPLKKRKEIGVVIETNLQKEDEPEFTIDLKEILALPYPAPVLDPTLLDMAKWISDYYFCPIGMTIRALIPTGLIPELSHSKSGAHSFCPRGKEKRIAHIAIAVEENEIQQYIASNCKRAPRQCDILRSLLLKGGKVSLSDLFPDQNIPYPLINKMLIKGILIRSMEREFRDPFIGLDKQKRFKEIKLSPDQEGALSHLFSSLDQGGFTPFLLHGVTGSGKTEIYLRLILRALQKNLQAIVLVPEISITHQLIERFKYYLADKVAILHSHLSEGERLDEWLRIREGLAHVVIGARSAVFAPLSRLGVIICDEEHDPSYKQESQPRYNGRDVAIMRAKMTSCLICLGSATPSLESYYNAKTGKFRLLTLPERVTTHPPPVVRIIDMREEYKSKDNQDDCRNLFSERFVEAIDDTLKKGKQTLIFQNRRGYSPFLLCPKCGYVPKCPNCSVSLTYHSTDNYLRCHYCDFQKGPPPSCPHCPETPMKYMGHGTQKIEQEIKGIFSNASVARMDRDTTARKGAHYRILDSVERGETDILVGTQMVTKGLDFPRVIMVGVVGIDHTLNLPDFRSTERVFQMITQVAGRAGRGDDPGMVFVQTFYPGHYSIDFASRHDYINFYNREIGFRRRLNYPPFTRIVCLTIKGLDRKKTRRAALFISKEIKSRIKPNEVRVLGPAMAPLFRLRRNYRYQIMLKAADYRIAHLSVREAIKGFALEKDFQSIKLEVDVDPVNLL